ncbi:MAG: nicotinamide-nucleotide amidohydrolase family protein [Gammaproteobacteria bacterium]|jgi:nicotinamide-nucleotide amidase
MSPQDQELENLAAQLGELLLERRWTVTTAESCTGGWIAKVLTDVPGSSQWFTRGYVTYSDAAKSEMLGVPPAEIATHGAVSEAVVEAMAVAAAQGATSDLAVAVSGIAGPGGAVLKKPIGTVWFAWCAPGLLRARMQHFEGDREAVRRQSVAVALDGLIAVCEAAG